MATNIEMNYFDGSSYIALRPKGNFGNIDGSLSSSQIPGLDASKIVSGTISNDRLPSTSSINIQKISYTGTGTSSVDVALKYRYPCFIIGGYFTSSYFTYGFNLSNNSNTYNIKMTIFYYENISSEAQSMVLGLYTAKIEFYKLTFCSNSPDNYISGEKQSILIKKPENLTCMSGSSVIQYFNANNGPCNYLIIY